MTVARRNSGRAQRLALLLALPVLLAAASPVWYPRYARFHPLRPSLATGVAAARKLVACARAWTAAHAGQAPAELSALGATDPRCRAETPRGWRATYTRDDSRPEGFTLVVRERVAPFASYRSLVATERGGLRFDEDTRDAGDGDPYLSAVPRELWRVGECVRAVLDGRPGHEPPYSLAELGPRGEGCDILPAGRWMPDGSVVLALPFEVEGSAAEERYRVTYVVGIDSTSAFVPRVEARPVRYPEDGVRSYLLIGDTLRATADDRPARADDPAVDRCEHFWPSGGCRSGDWSTRMALAPWAGPRRGPAEPLPRRDPSIVWTAPLGIRPLDGAPPTGLAAPTVGPDGSVYAASPAGIHSFLVSGARRWWRPDLAAVEEGGVAVIGDQLLVPTRDSGLVALDLVSGATRWRSSALPGGLAYRPVALPGNAIAVVNRTGALAVFEADGRVRWSRRVGSSFYSAPVADAAGTLYAVVDGRETELVAIDAQGKERRRTRVGGWRTPPILLADGTVLVASGAGLFAVERKGGSPRKLAASAQDADRLLARADGSIVYSDDRRLIAMAPNGVPLWSWRPTPVPPSLAGPALLPDGSIVFAEPGSLHAVSATGDSLWTVPIGNAAIVSTPVVGPDGTVYVTDSRWRLTAVRH